MQFELTEEQALIGETARRFGERHGKLVGNAAFGQRECWTEMADAGFLALGLSEELGGFGGAVEIALVAREFGRQLLMQPFSASAIFAAQLVAHAGDGEQCDLYLPQLISGELLAAVAYLDPDLENGAGLAKASAGSGGYVLSGRKLLVLGGLQADLFVVSARLNGEDGVGATKFFIVDPDTAGLEVIPLRLVDGSNCAELVMREVALPANAMLRSEIPADEALERALRFATVSVCAEMEGIALAAKSAAIDHLKLRRQFGESLSSFQVLRHRVANMVIDCQMARSALDKLLACFDDPDDHDPALATALAKAMVDEIGIRVTKDAIQMHGAMGLTEECAVGHYHARATLIRSIFGSGSEHMTAYSRQLAGHLQAGKV